MQVCGFGFESPNVGMFNFYLLSDMTEAYILVLSEFLLEILSKMFFNTFWT